MNNRILLVLGLLTITSASLADTRSAYVGQENREIKSLSAQNIQDYLDGKGMGYAKPAELNHYPGPRHVLDMAQQLKLSDEQNQRSQALFKKMQANASALGRQLVDKEAELDKRFASGKIDRDSLNRLLREIGELTAQIRFVHLSAHLEQQSMLSREQIAQYDQLRGYGDNATGHMHQHDHHGDGKHQSMSH